MSQSKITTIKLDDQTKLRLDKLKIHKKESYDEILQKMLYLLNLCKDNPLEAKRKLEELDKARKIFMSKESKK